MHSEHAPASRRKTRVTKGMIKRLKDGGKRADAIAKMSRHHHQQHEVPKAEAQLLDKLGDVYTEPLTTLPAAKPPKRSWLQRIFPFLYRTHA